MIFLKIVSIFVDLILIDREQATAHAKFSNSIDEFKLVFIKYFFLKIVIATLFLFFIILNPLHCSFI